MRFEIRRAQLDDESALGEFLDSHLRKDYFVTRAQLHEILDGRYHEMVVATDSCTIVGIAIMTRSARTLVNLLVRPADRRRGIGDALLSFLQVERIRAKLDVSDGDPRDFYRNRGFRSTGRFNIKRNIEIMVVDLDSPPEWADFSCSSIMPLFCDLA